MLGERPLADGIRFLRTVATNQVARVAPGFFVRWTRETGRGQERDDTPESVADYFAKTFYEYFDVLGVASGDIERFLAGKCVLEYGPGDVPAVALLMLAYGARRAICVDRFQLHTPSPKSVDISSALMARLDGSRRARAQALLKDPSNVAAGFRDDRLCYMVCANGRSGLHETADLVLSRAVLEHVNDLDATFQDMYAALKANGRAVHLVDLRSHGLHRRNHLDFLTWPVSLWSLMFSAKGAPNRWRVDRYRAATRNAGLRVLSLKVTERADPETVREVRAHLARPFRKLSDEDLSCLQFWLLCEKPGRPSADPSPPRQLHDS
jgi:SAM-dependent methyltransferase